MDANSFIFFGLIIFLLSYLMLRYYGLDLLKTYSIVSIVGGLIVMFIAVTSTYLSNDAEWANNILIGQFIGDVVYYTLELVIIVPLTKLLIPLLEGIVDWIENFND